MQYLPNTVSLLSIQNYQLVSRFAPSQPNALSSLQCNFTRRISRTPNGKFWAVDLSALLQSSQCLSVLPLLLHRLLLLVPIFFISFTRCVVTSVPRVAVPVCGPTVTATFRIPDCTWFAQRTSEGSCVVRTENLLSPLTSQEFLRFL
jgi:hypothetical protein